MNFNDLDFKPRRFGIQGDQAIIFFENGYGASIIFGEGTYSSENTYELAVLKGGIEGWDINYDTEITNDVLGYLSKTEIEETLEKIKSL